MCRTVILCGRAVCCNVFCSSSLSLLCEKQLVNYSFKIKFPPFLYRYFQLICKLVQISTEGISAVIKVKICFKISCDAASWSVVTKPLKG